MPGAGRIDMRYWTLTGYGCAELERTMALTPCARPVVDVASANVVVLGYESMKMVCEGAGIV
jgi:hypothetical protein